MATKKKPAAAPVAAVSAEDKKKALETAISQMEKRFGKGTIIKMGENPRMNVSAVSTGSSVFIGLYQYIEYQTEYQQKCDYGVYLIIFFIFPDLRNLA